MESLWKTVLGKFKNLSTFVTHIPKATLTTHVLELLLLEKWVRTSAFQSARIGVDTCKAALTNTPQMLISESKLISLSHVNRPEVSDPGWWGDPALILTQEPRSFAFYYSTIPYGFILM